MAEHDGAREAREGHAAQEKTKYGYTRNTWSTKECAGTWCKRKVPPADGTVDVIVKLGGAAITVKDGEPDTPNLDALITCCRKIADAVNTHGLYLTSPPMTNNTSR
jgi:hypothetical protein